MIPHPQYVEWQKIKLDSRYLQTPTELKRQMERLFGALDGYLTKRKGASDEVKRILDSVLEEFKLPPCRIENFGSVVLGDVMSGKRKGIYGESMYFMEEDVPDEAVIKKVNERFYEMADVRTAVVLAGFAAAALVDRTVVVGVFLVHHVHFAVPREEIAVTCISRRHYAVEEINAAVYGFENVLRRTDTHEVARLVLRHIRLDCLDYAVHLLRALAYGKSADRVSRAVDLADALHVLDAEILVCAALVYAEQHLLGIQRVLKRVQSVHLTAAALKPASRAVAGRLDVLVFRGIFDAFVKRHRNGGRKV